MKLAYLYIVIGLFFISCSQSKQNGLDNEPFNLDSDIYDFSSKLKNGDTLNIYSNLSICNSFHSEHDIITKEDSKVFIQTHAIGDFIGEEWEENLPKTEYKHSKIDSLNFEDLFRFISKNKTQAKKARRATFRIVYKMDTIEFYSNGLGEKIPNTAYFLKIKHKIYPNAEIYVPIEKPQIPPPPPPPSVE